LFPRTVVSYFVADGKKQTEKKQKKTSVKHTHPPHRRLHKSVPPLAPGPLSGVQKLVRHGRSDLFGYVNA